jgi:hypothetical protein
MGAFEEEFEVLADMMSGSSSKSGADQARMRIEQLVGDMREEVASQWPKNPRVFKEYVSRKAFDKGIAIAERHDLHRPKLTEKLSDAVLASYIFLLRGGDRDLGKMFKELSEWQSRLPRPPWAP